MINQVTLVGRLTKDPEARKTTEGKSVLSVTIAISRPYKNQQGQIDADFVLCTIWNRAAENTEKYCRKGSVVGVTGRIQTRYFENDQGKRTYITEVVAENVRFLDSKQASSATTEPSKKEPIELPF
ncbi:single-stranded DNA-binding protein [Rossellomorea sp. SC111]|uniref:single-stranded DNA-binding protein n=1 Tax=Rossellomorea sp. SC111 TaxID=2968985 RepID=UPI00215B4008|nr:single-stranded DNA-binding protein [Rossellomorea sp. SC111]MCR8850591.1 single-stranded DNA-binding protein [Rossellomorea sp. SC111]